MDCFWLITALVPLLVKTNSTLKGLRFLDNNTTIPWIDKNGQATFDLPLFPSQITFCMKIYQEFERYAHFAGLLFIQDVNSGNVLLNVEISNRRHYNLVIEFPSGSGSFEWHFGGKVGRANFLRQWTWICFSLDMEKKQANLALNGRILPQKHDPNLETGYYTNTSCQLVLGHFWRDSNPLSGRY